MSVRALNAVELAEVKSVFQSGLDLMRVRIIEGSEFPNTIGRIGAWLRRTKPPEANAITLANTSYFPVTLTTPNPDDPLWLRDMGWLMHELTHQWQFQHDGLRYLIEAILAPTYVYAPSGQSPNEALKDFSQAGKHFADFNREQQGDIVRDYYFNLKQSQDVSGWATFLAEVRTPRV
jgi:hypothetical protein